MTKQTKITIVVGSIVSALLIATIVTVAVMINTMNSQAEHAAYRDCMARYGFAADAPLPQISDDDEAAVDEYLDAISAAADKCLSD